MLKNWESECPIDVVLACVGSAPQLVNGKAHDLGRITTVSHLLLLQNQMSRHSLPVRLRGQLRCACWPERQSLQDPCITLA